MKPHRFAPAETPSPAPRWGVNPALQADPSWELCNENQLRACGQKRKKILWWILAAIFAAKAPCKTWPLRPNTLQRRPSTPFPSSHPFSTANIHQQALEVPNMKPLTRLRWLNWRQFSGQKGNRGGEEMRKVLEKKKALPAAPHPHRHRLSPPPYGRPPWWRAQKKAEAPFCPHTALGAVRPLFGEEMKNTPGLKQIRHLPP